MNARVLVALSTECPKCSGAARFAPAAVDISQAGGRLRVMGMPAYKCTDCRHQFYELHSGAAAMKLIQEFIVESPPPTPDSGLKLDWQFLGQVDEEGIEPNLVEGEVSLSTSLSA